MFQSIDLTVMILISGKRYWKLREEEEQDAHSVREVRPPQLPPSEEPLRRLRLPGRPHPQIQLERESDKEKDHRHWQDEVPPPPPPPLQVQLPRRYGSCSKEEADGTVGLVLRFFW
ncbi:hypothetical protein QJS04_geneDACA023596 [Acorus gramineus]|uniref:Uncharacterized protein n=1 Tax=Acorus gramineus TaxID=55184 RepID=A0AAV9AKJ9_ACOGR|nr:hypothetical protein QJS04_geneDACA023596 [Acorus gramineus]